MVYLRSIKGMRKRKAEWIHVDSVRESVDLLTDRTALILPDSLASDQYELARNWTRERGARLAVLVSQTNARGAVLAGIVPTAGPNGMALHQLGAQPGWAATTAGAGRSLVDICNSSANGEIDLLLLVGHRSGSNRILCDTAENAVERAKFSVVLDMFPSKLTEAADVVLPTCSFAEKDGTFVNTDGIRQVIQPAFPPRGGSRPEWRIMADLLARLGAPTPYFSASDVRRELDELLERIA